MVLTIENRRTLAERVQRKVAGRGISRRDVDDAVDRVARALAARHPSTAPVVADPTVHHATSCGCAKHAQPELLAVLSASAVPDLASRARDALSRDGVAVQGLGVGHAGRHTVVALRAAVVHADAIRRVAERFGASIAFPPIDAEALG